MSQVLNTRDLNTCEWITVEKNGMRLLQSPQLCQASNLVHAFTTRIGGNTKPPHDAFNLGKHQRYDSTDAIFNRQKLCEGLGINFNSLTVPGQHHTANVDFVESHNESSQPHAYSDADGLATDLNNLPMMITYADCVPIILYDQTSHTIAVVHAGWRGTASGILKNALNILKQKRNIDLKNIFAAIGPAIGCCCYPTDESVANQLMASVNNSQDLVSWKNGKPHPDLKAINARQLQEQGVSRIDICPLCTACNPDLFYSHRKFNGATGRHGALACIKK